MKLLRSLVLMSTVLLTFSGCQRGDDQKDGEWQAYSRDPGGMRFSPLDQINRENVDQLKPAWTYRTGELELNKNSEIFRKKAAFETTPIMVDGKLFFTTQTTRVIALDAETGKELWVFDPEIEEANYSEVTSRGVATWKGDGLRLIFFGTLDGRLIALNAETGIPHEGFGEHGEVSLFDEYTGKSKVGMYEVTSPPAVIGNKVIVGTAIGDNRAVELGRGTVRCFDVLTGKLVWAWDPIPRQKGEPGFDTWKGPIAHKTGAANVWSIISVDPDRDLVFLPTTSPSPDYYGGERLGKNLFANSIVALRASTGEMVWHFQAVHHDLWDYDIAMQPALIDVKRDGKAVPAVSFGTKMGHIFVLNRETGEPLFPVEEREVPKSDVPGEEAWPTQPFPVKPRHFGLREVNPDDAWAVTEEEKKYAREWMSKLRNDGIFTPASFQGTIMSPSNVGGMNWGGVAFDPERYLLVTPNNRLAAVITLIPREEVEGQKLVSGERLEAEIALQKQTPYIMKREYLIAKNLAPYTPPPWGTLAAVDMNSGDVKWEVPLGYTLDPEEYPDSEKWGSINLGGPIITKGGLVFIAATVDGHLRAFDIDTGDVLWKHILPVPAQATPMTYEVNGRQFVLMAAGGHGKMGTKQGDYIVAFALPK